MILPLLFYVLQTLKVCPFIAIEQIHKKTKLLIKPFHSLNETEGL